MKARLAALKRARLAAREGVFSGVVNGEFRVLAFSAYLLTLKLHVFSFARALPAKSFAPVLTVAT